MAVRLTKSSAACGISIIVPVYNEADIIRDAMSSLVDQLAEQDELIVVDGGSSDATLAQLQGIKDPRVRIIQSEAAGRAAQMNAGAALASNPQLLFLHIDTLLPPTALAEVRSFSGEEHWGRFDVALDNRALPYRVISWFINWRSALTSIATGDQAIFVDKSLFEKIDGYADQPLMEDVELSKQLKQSTQAIRLRTRVVTSARKWETEGIIRTVWLMWVLRAKYARGASPSELHAKYYR